MKTGHLARCFRAFQKGKCLKKQEITCLTERGESELRKCKAAGLAGREMGNGFFQTHEIQRKHREYLPDQADGRAGIPEGCGEGVKPGGMAEGLGEKFQPLYARLLLPEFDCYRSVQGH